MKFKNSPVEIPDLLSTQRGAGWKFLLREPETGAVTELEPTAFSPSLSHINSASVILFAENPT